MMVNGRKRKMWEKMFIERFGHESRLERKIAIRVLLWNGERWCEFGMLKLGGLKE